MPPSARTVRTRPRSARGEGEALRDELLDAAERQLLTAGTMDAVSIRSIVQEVGVSPPSLYLHFEDKDDLFFAVCERRFADFGEVLQAAADGLDDPVERLRAMGNAYVHYGLEHGEHYQIMFGASSPGAAAESRLTLESPSMLAMQLLVGAVAEAIESGRFRESDVMLTAMTIWSAVHGVVMLYLAKADMSGPMEYPEADAVMRNACDVILRGLTSG